MVAIKVYKPYEKRPNVPKGTAKSKYTFALASRTIKPCLRHYQPQRIPLTTQQRESRRDRGKKRRKEIKQDMKDLNREFEVRCAALAKKYKRKEHYFKDMFFQGGESKLFGLAPHNNADRAQGGIIGLNTVQIAKWYGKEYRQLSRPENRALMRQIIHRAHAQDFANTASNMKKMLTTAKKRIGLEGFFVLVRNHTQGFTAPKWYFSNPAIEPYMKVILRSWDMDQVGFKLEAFAIAGCRAENLSTRSDEKAKALKYRIREKTRQLLSDALGGQPVNLILWDRFDEQFTLVHGIVPKNWPGPFQNPSRMSNKIGLLQYLADGLDKETIGFIHLDPDELEEWKEGYVEKRRQLEKEKGAEADNAEGDDIENPKATGKKTKKTATKPAATSKPATRKKKVPSAERLAPPTSSSSSSSSSTSSNDSDSDKSESKPRVRPNSKPKSKREPKGQQGPRHVSTSTPPAPNTPNNIRDNTLSNTPPPDSPLFLPAESPQSPSQQFSPSHNLPQEPEDGGKPEDEETETLGNGMSRRKRIKRVQIAPEVDKSKKRHVELDGKGGAADKATAAKSRGRAKSVGR
ncbi:hypothetical protein Moror_14579 [Moniliophthora roreri MCA 2997]|uniref:Uncharacterized protein n=2 Tax=Moniliophthora roreri TaxID=221103 RepID=V2XHR7_MONRO|nr:hypothetical protein Moror_14579 [Moniliophthora roreri MCA 2997]